MLVEKTLITLNSIRTYAYHGVLSQERAIGAWYTVSLRIDYPFNDALITDNVEDTLDYSQVLAIVNEEMAVPSNLIEHVAGRICESIFKLYPRTKSIEIELTKDNPPMGSDTMGAGVLLRANNDK